MAVRKDGKVYEAVVEALKERGQNTADIQVFTTNRGSRHEVVLDGRIIGEYNHRWKQLILYGDIVNE